jgi:hypothetical protein
MKIEEYNNFYHVDISTQIDNKWRNNTALGIVKNLRKYSIMIKSNDKEYIKKHFILDENVISGRTHNKKVIAIIYSYLLYKALGEFNEANPLLLCRDVRPEKFVINYLQKIASFFKNYSVLNRKIKFRKRIEFETRDKLPKSLAGKYVRKVYQGKIKANKILDDFEIKQLIEIIGKIL